jgi:hypothetical protein
VEALELKHTLRLNMLWHPMPNDIRPIGCPIKAVHTLNIGREEPRVSLFQLGLIVAC